MNRQKCPGYGNLRERYVQWIFKTRGGSCERSFVRTTLLTCYYISYLVLPRQYPASPRSYERYTVSSANTASYSSRARILTTSVGKAASTHEILNRLSSVDAPFPATLASLWHDTLVSPGNAETLRLTIDKHRSSCYQPECFSGNWPVLYVSPCRSLDKHHRRLRASRGTLLRSRPGKMQTCRINPLYATRKFEQRMARFLSRHLRGYVPAPWKAWRTLREGNNFSWVQFLLRRRSLDGNCREFMGFTGFSSFEVFQWF